MVENYLVTAEGEERGECWGSKGGKGEEEEGRERGYSFRMRMVGDGRPLDSGDSYDEVTNRRN